VSEKTYLGTSLLVSVTGRGEKRSLKHRLPLLTLLGNLAQLGIQSHGRKRVKKIGLTFGSWNVHTLLDYENRGEKRSAIIARMLRDYHIDVVALTETRLSEESSFEEIGAVYTFSWIGKPDGIPRTSCVGFSIRSSLAHKLESLQEEFLTGSWSSG